MMAEEEVLTYHISHERLVYRRVCYFPERNVIFLKVKGKPWQELYDSTSMKLDELRRANGIRKGILKSNGWIDPGRILKVKSRKKPSEAVDEFIRVVEEDDRRIP
jgi:hypothetical protein